MNIKMTLGLAALAAIGLPLAPWMGLLSIPHAATGSAMATTVTLWAAGRVWSRLRAMLRKALVIMALISLGLLALMVL